MTESCANSILSEEARRFRTAYVFKQQSARELELITKSLSTARAALKRKSGFRNTMRRLLGVSK